MSLPGALSPNAGKAGPGLSRCIMQKMFPTANAECSDQEISWLRPDGTLHLPRLHRGDQ